jgi:hypothetical protein
VANYRRMTKWFPMTEDELFQKEMQETRKVMQDYLMERIYRLNQVNFYQSIHLQELMKRSDEAIRHAQELMEPKTDKTSHRKPH